jgi:hypothetical protein
MTHFDTWQWADFVRGLGDIASRSLMQTHLSSGCASCLKTVDTLRQVVEMASADAECAPPEYAVRYAQAAYTIRKPEPVSLARLIARLVHDSAREPLPAGLRAQDRLQRRALFAAGDYQVDLQLERQPVTHLITLVGQVAGRLHSTSLADVPVWLMERDSMVENTTCNTFGEFHLEYEPRRNLRLLVPLSDVGKRLEIALDHLIPGGRLPSRGANAARNAAKRKPRGQA